MVKEDTEFQFVQALNASCPIRRERSSLERVLRSQRRGLNVHRLPLANLPTISSATEILRYLGLFPTLTIDILISVKQFINAVLIY